MRDTAPKRTQVKGPRPGIWRGPEQAICSARPVMTPSPLAGPCSAGHGRDATARVGIPDLSIRAA